MGKRVIFERGTGERKIGGGGGREKDRGIRESDDFEE